MHLKICLSDACPEGWKTNFDYKQVFCKVAYKYVMSTLHLEVKQLKLVLNKNLSNMLMNPCFLLNRIQSLVCHSQCSVLDSNLGF